MAVTVQLQGLREAVIALNQLEGRLKFKHMRIALNAAMAPVKAQIIATAPENTELLRKSIRIKPVVPPASQNPAHWSKPSYALVGPGRGLIGVRSVSKKGKIGNISPRTIKAANKLTTSGRGEVVTVRETQRFKGSPNFGQIIVRPKRASRYAHFVEKGRKGKGATHFMANAAIAAASAAHEAFHRKIKQGLAQVAAELHTQQRVAIH